MAANLKQYRLVISTYVRIHSSKKGRVAGEYNRLEDDRSLDRGLGAYRYCYLLVAYSYGKESLSV